MSDCSKALNILSLSFSKIPIPVSSTLKIKCILLFSNFLYKAFKVTPPLAVNLIALEIRFIKT